MKDIQSVLRNYMSFIPKVNPSRERLLQAYYSYTDRRQDPCFTKVESEDLEVLDYCDYFPGDKWKGPSLVLYAPDLSINKPELEPFCNFPMHVLKDSAYTYYGMKMNILAYLLDRPVENLIVFYDGNNKFNVLRSSGWTNFLSTSGSLPSQSGNETVTCSYALVTATVESCSRYFEVYLMISFFCFKAVLQTIKI